MIEMIKIKKKTTTIVVRSKSQNKVSIINTRLAEFKKRERERLLVSSTFNIVAFSFMLCLTFQ
ncbi:hypothetical protein BCR42DRAFT_406001 [Absidia repens]|uniref:Uncharacterized protein n=1 Tax=Absidia repens TaxID=90262 RepID=A0A1X2IUB3_9FUNG|nr:hypothetical protein BCR42DRAFT_406001 [Absidia repens]